MKNKNEETKKGFDWSSTPNAPQIYANLLHIGWTLDDIRITFGTLKADNVKGKTFRVKEEGSAIISWRVAKILRDSLIRCVESYEEKNGEITTPNLADPERKDES